MEREALERYEKHIEQSLSKISAKIADAADLSQKARQLSAKSELLLINIQRELEELYISLDKQALLNIESDANSANTDCESIDIENES